MGELLFTAAMLVVFGIFFSGAGSIETGRSVDPVGASFVPYIVIIFAGILCVATLVTQLKKYLAANPRPGIKLNAKALILLGILVVFLLVLDVIGFHIAAIMLFFSVSLLLGNKSYLRNAITAVVSATVFTLIFGNVLSVPLPRGDGFFRIMSHWFF